MQGYVCGLLFDEDAQHLVVINKTKPEWQRGLINVPGGKIENGETAHFAMIREFKEETGIYIPEWEHFLTLGDNKTYYVMFYRQFTNSIILNGAKTLTEEIVSIVNIYDIPQLDTVYNLKWISLLALEEGIKYSKIDYK